MIPYMAKIAMSMDVNGIFMEVHNEPDASKCDAPTQWPLNKFEEIIELKNKYYHKDKISEQQQEEQESLEGFVGRMFNTVFNRNEERNEQIAAEVMNIIQAGNIDPAVEEARIEWMMEDL